ncbi:MAG TPA: hypothetical protein PK671_08790, partial [Candidatus Obscuribacter sp.]|nr:hypothetical protein [Candidatus Obscuribacter sp.]
LPPLPQKQGKQLKMRRAIRLLKDSRRVGFPKGPKRLFCAPGRKRGTNKHRRLKAASADKVKLNIGRAF